ncbi:MAG: PilZ domain-containing protein [Deltaproteobacteria bacterium]|nr:PilZ domain-containing protein [Deltaproteobacteria bacterium]MBW2019259.1 PilZ domain-containing protein [Deltaproteobacteria bacterium]MBW2074065.1 PilZ domain-containing protein [Deltaproteobacteria bacterium]
MNSIENLSAPHIRQNSSSRSHVRADGFIILKYMRLTGEEYIRRREQYLNENPEHAAELSDPGFYLGLESDTDTGTIPVEILNEIYRIHKKLDHLRKLMSSSEKVDLFVQKPMKVNLSGAGVRFNTSDCFQVGDLLDIKMTLPTSPFLVIQAVGKVVRFGKLSEQGPTLEEPSNYVAIKFIAINEDNREAIIRCVFTWQRKALRERSMRRKGKRISYIPLGRRKANSLLFH